MKKNITKSLVVLLTCSIIPAIAASTAGYQYLGDISLPQTGQTEEIAQVVLPLELYLVTRDDLSDLRVIRKSDSQPIPFLVKYVTREEEQRYRRQETFAMSTLPDATNPPQSLRFLLTRSAQAAGNTLLMGISINTPLTQFEQFVDVEASADGENWRFVAQKAQIFDYSPFANIRVTDIPLPSISDKYLRITFAQAFVPRISQNTQVRTTGVPSEEPSQIERTFTEEKIPFRVTGISAWGESKRLVPGIRPIYPRPIQSLDNLPDDLVKEFPNCTVLAFDTQRVPIERIELDSPSRILKGRYKLFIETTPTTPGTSPWKLIKTGTIERTRFRNYKCEDMNIVLSPPLRATRYAIVFASEADDTPTLSIKTAQGPDYRIVFPYRPSEDIALLVGQPNQLAGKSSTVGYYAAQVSTLLRNVSTPVSGTLAPLQANPAYNKDFQEEEKSALDMNLILSLAIAFAVGILGFALFKAMQRIPAE